MKINSTTWMLLTVACAMLLTLSACGGSGGGASPAPPVAPPGATFTATSGVAQKGPLIKGSTVTAQELDAMLSPTGAQYSYQITSNLGTFSPTSKFGSQYIGVLATGYYFDEVGNAVSSGTITLNGYSDLGVDSVLNVNLLTTLEYQRIQNLVTKSNLTFAAARTQAENEVLAALNIPAGSYGSFDTLDLSGTSDGDHILAAISALFVYGNSAGTLSQLIANFQSDIGANGVITNPVTTAALVAAAKAINPAAVAANLTQYYATPGLTFTAANISEWIAQSGDGVIGQFAFQVPDATPSTVFTFPASVVTQFAGMPVSVTVGQLSVNGTPASGTVSFNAGDVVTVSPNVGDFPNGVLNSYLIASSKNLVKVSFVSGLVSIAVTPSTLSIPKGLTQQFTATGTFSDTSTANLTAMVAWTSGTPANATISMASGLANALAVGSTVISATSGSVSGSVTLTVTPAVVESISITPSTASVGVGTTTQLTATGTYSDGTVQNVTAVANWSSKTPPEATVGPTTGLATGVAPGSTTISAAMGSVTGTASLSVVTNVWLPASPLIDARTYHSATLLQNGQVLAVGGVGNNNAVYASPELYDSVSNSWTLAGSLAAARYLHTATLLQNGEVLVAAGYGVSASPPPLSSAEIYDPVANVWSSAGNLATARIGHTATLLPNGQVLVVGGEDGNNNAFSNAQIYDPVSNSWSPAASMSTPRSYHTATLLPNGLVLVAGGTNGSTTLVTAEMYNPATNSWSLAGPLSAARANHSATLLQNGMTLLAGGFTNNGTLAVTDLYNPTTNTWSAGATMITARYGHTATLLSNGTLLAAGGTNSVGSPLTSAEIYNPSTNVWSAAAGLLLPLDYSTATLLNNGVVLVTGGQTVTQSGGLVTNSAQIYYP